VCQGLALAKSARRVSTKALRIYHRACSLIIDVLNANLHFGWPYKEDEVSDAVEALFPALEIGDTVFEDWYGSSGYYGASMDNGGAAAFVHGAPVRNWREMDLANAKIDLYLNGQYIKSGYGRAAMGNPLTSLTWIVNWLQARGKILRAGEFVSTGTCTGHFFAAPGDHLKVDFGEIGEVAVTYE